MHKTGERKGYKRGTARNFLHSFPLSGTPVVQSYWAWILGLSAPQRCNAERSDAQRIFSHRYSYPFFYSVIAVMPFPIFQHRT